MAETSASAALPTSTDTCPTKTTEPSDAYGLTYTPPERVDRRVGTGRVFLRLIVVSWAFWWLLAVRFANLIQLRRLFYLIRLKTYEKLRPHRQLRLTFERLGPSYIKFGQMIASSEGIFSKELSAEFRKTLDEVPAFSDDAVQWILEHEFKKPLDEIYASFEMTPMAAASIAQVHGAELHDGTSVVVKVRRPKLLKRVASDVRIMLFVARVAERFSLRARLGNVVGVVEDFARTISEEMDFRLEAQSMDAFNELMYREEGNRVCAPKVHWDYTNRRVLTMERFVGRRADDPELVNVLDDPEGELVEGLKSWFRCILEASFFHGDVHAGNMMFLDDKRIGFLDFGIVGRFNALQRKQALGFMLSMATKNFEQLAEIVIEMQSKVGAFEHLIVEELAVDLKAAYEPLVGMSMSQLDYGQVVPNIMRASVKHGLKFPQEFVLITKQMLYFDRYARLLAPDLNMFQDPRIFGMLAKKLPEFASPEEIQSLMMAAMGAMS